MAQNSDIKNNENQSKQDFFPESRENIIEGARVFSEKASDIFNKFLDKLRETAEAAYEKGSEIFESAALTAQDYIDKYRDRSEIADLKKLRDEVATQLGNMCYIEFSGRYRFRVDFTRSEEFRNLVSQIRELDKQIVKIGKRLEEEKK
jgi:hypothetical protein